jgi:hypothetical protein
MRKALGISVMASSLLAGTALVGLPSNALACGCLPPAYASTVATSTGAISAGFGMLTLMISNSFGALNASLSAQSSSMAEVTSYQNSEYTQLARYEARYNLLNDFTFAHDPCISYDATTRSGPKELGSRQVRRQLSDANDLALRNMTTETSGTAEANAAARIRTMEERYCGEREEALGRCTPSGDLVSRPYLRDGHIKPLYFKFDTMDDVLARAANDFAQTLNGPVPAAPASVDYNTPDGRYKVVERTTRDARIDTATETWEYLISLRKEVGEDDAQWANALREHTTGSSDPNVNGSNPEATKQSLYELLAMQNEYRFKDSTWVTGIMGGTPTELSLLKELAVMEATNLFTEWKRFELDQRIAGNLAVILATKSDEVYERAQPE